MYAANDEYDYRAFCTFAIAAYGLGVCVEYLRGSAVEGCGFLCVDFPDV